MWNNRHLIKIKIRSGKVRFTIPLPLFIGLQLFDYLEDLMSIMVFFLHLEGKLQLTIRNTT